ncbi:hypothetical protein KAW08_04120 [bacterium]|nr:hypothetical protein [bacterium]
MEKKKAKVCEEVRELTSAQEDLIKAEKLALVGQAVLEIMHELSHDISLIRNIAEIMQADFPPRAKNYHKNLSMIVSRTDKAMVFIDKCRTINSPIKLELKILNIHEVMDEVIHLLDSMMASKKVEIKKKYTQLPSLRGDNDQLQQVFINLFLNSLHAMPHGGEIIIHTCIDKKEPDFISIEFQDTGKGIKKENLNKIWEPLFTTSKEGQGLGLSITKSIIEKHSGMIDVQSTEGAGTTFNIYLPYL